MAERLDIFDFDAASPSRKGHPWEEWLDGNPWRLARGVDFQGTTINFVSTAWKRAAERGRGLRTHRNGDVVVLQATLGVERPTPERND